MGAAPRSRAAGCPIWPDVSASLLILESSALQPHGCVTVLQPTFEAEQAERGKNGRHNPKALCPSATGGSWLQGCSAAWHVQRSNHALCWRHVRSAALCAAVMSCISAAFLAVPAASLQAAALGVSTGRWRSPAGPLSRTASQRPALQAPLCCLLLLPTRRRSSTSSRHRSRGSRCSTLRSTRAGLPRCSWPAAAPAPARGSQCPTSSTPSAARGDWLAMHHSAAGRDGSMTLGRGADSAAGRNTSRRPSLTVNCLIVAPIFSH